MQQFNLAAVDCCFCIFLCYHFIMRSASWLMVLFHCCSCQRAGTKGQDPYTVHNSVKWYTLFVKKLENLHILVFICAEQAKYKMWECQMWMSSCKNTWHFSKMSVVFATWHQSLTFRIAKNGRFSKKCQMSGIQSQNLPWH